MQAISKDLEVTIENLDGVFSVPTLSSTIDANGVLPLQIEGMGNGGLDGYSIDTVSLIDAETSEITYAGGNNNDKIYGGNHNDKLYGERVMTVFTWIKVMIFLMVVRVRIGFM